MLHVVLLVGAAISFGLAAAGPPFPSRINLVALGLLLWELTELLAVGR